MSHNSLTFVSVIIPCYNSSKTIKRAITSVINQTHKNTEIICIDDGSSDDTVNILNTLSQSIANLTILINDKNRGPSYSRNKGVLHSNGDFIAFLDSDDYWHHQKLEYQMVIMHQNNWNFIGAITKVKLNTTYNIHLQDLTCKKVTFTQLLFRNYFSTPTVLMSKELFKDFNENQKYSEDYKLWLDILKSKNTRAGIILHPHLVGLDKFAYGVSGLSSNLWQMEKYELKNYWDLLKRGTILALLCIPYSFIKFIRRVIIVKLKKIQGTLK